MGSLASINVRFAVDLREFSTEMQGSLRTIDKWGQKFQAVGRNMSAYVTLPIVAAGAAAVKFASDYNESLNKVDVSFKASSTQVKDFAKTSLESFGIAEGTALDMAAAYGDMGTSMGLTTGQAAKMSTSLVGLAGDLASFKNISIDIANTAISAIFTGETESLKKLGIVMTEVNLKHFALSSGIKKNYEQMSQAEKVQLRYNYILSVTKNSQGDFIRTQGGAANQTRIFQESLKQVGQQLGQVILPLFTKLITVVNQKIKAFLGLSEATKTTIVVVAGLVAVIGPLALAIGGILAIIPSVVAGFTLISASILPILAGLTLLMGAFLILKNATKETTAAQNDLNKAVEAGNKNAINEVTALDRLYASATNVKNSTEKRNAAASEMLALYPVMFKGLDTEAIKNGIAEESYNKLRNAIFNKSRAAAIDNQLQLNANERISKEIELQDKLAAARKNLDNVQKNGKDENISLGTGTGATYFSSKEQQVKAAALALKNIKTELAAFTAASLKSDESLLNAKQVYDSKTAKLTENEIARLKAEEAAAAVSAKGKEESLKKGTIAFYDKQIEGLKKLQKEIPVTNSAWKTYESQIDAIQKKIDGLQNKGVNIPKPQLSQEVDFEPQTLNLDFYEQQLSRYKVLQGEFSTNSEEGRKKFQAYAEAISNTELIIQDIQGIDKLVESTEKIKATIYDLSEAISSALTELAVNAAVGFGEAVGGLISGTESLGGVFNSMLGIVFDFMKSLGKSLIEIGVATIAAKKLMSNPYTAIVAGVALVALSGALQSTLSKGPKGFANGGIVGGASFYGDKILARVNSGELILNNKQQKAVYNAMNPAVNASDVAVQILGNFDISGDKLQLVLARAQNRKSRTS